MDSAHSTALDAAIRKLSEATHSQKLLVLLASETIETRILFCPAAFTLLGASSAASVMITCSPAKDCDTLEMSIACCISTCTEKACPWKIGACTSNSEGTGPSLPAIC